MSVHSNGSATRGRAAPRRHRRLDERGIALPMAMIFVALLTMLMLAFAVLGQTEALIATNHSQMSQARALAESGYEHALWALTEGVRQSPAPGGSLAHPLPSPSPQPFDGSVFVASGVNGGYFVSVSEVSADERRIRARGCVPNCAAGTRQAQRIVEALVERYPDLALSTPCALCVRGDVNIGGTSLVEAISDTSCGNKKGAVSAGTVGLSGAATVYGADADPDTANEATDYLQNADAEEFDGITLTQKHFDKLRELAKLNGTYFGPGHPNGTPAASPDWGGSVTFNSGNKVKSGIVFVDTVSGNEIPTDTSLQDPNDFASVTIHGNPFLDATFQGWIIVNGSLHISGGMQINGLVYSVNDFTYNGTGAGQITGLVVSQNVRDTVATSISDDGSTATTGNSRIRFNCEATRAANFVPQGFFLQAGTYRELEGDSL